LALDRQLCGAMNVCLRMKGFTSSLSVFCRVAAKPMTPLWEMHVGRGVASDGGPRAMTSSR